MIAIYITLITLNLLKETINLSFSSVAVREMTKPEL